MENWLSLLSSIIMAGAIVFSVIMPMVLLRKSKAGKKEGDLDFVSLNKKLKHIKDKVNLATGEIKAKDLKKEKEEYPHKKVYNLSFKGDVKASQVSKLREEITLLLAIAKQGDEFVINLESPGGSVQGYSLAAEQLARIKRAGFTLTVCVDTIAASGGYMMAVVADKIVAAPNAIVGSIGVVAEFPNFKEMLSKLGISWKQYTAGEFKRTVSVMGEITEDAEKHFQESLEECHKMFTKHVTKYRSLDATKIANGDHWMAYETVDKKLNLVDELKVSDDVLLEKTKEAEVLIVNYKKPPKNMLEAINKISASCVDYALDKIENRILSYIRGK